ncbi:MAG: hypothetical protein ACK564_10910 [Novosphingobium sp.]
MRDVTDRMGAIVAGLLALGLVTPAAAQDVFSLPPGTSTPTARPAGPVDADAPVVRPRPTQSATPQPSATPTASPSPSTRPTATPAPTRAAPRPTTAAPRPARTAAATPAPAGDALTSPGTATPPAAATFPTAIPTLAPAASAPAAEPASASDWTAFATSALVGALALLALVGGLIWRRRKPGAAAAVDFEPPVVPAARPEPQHKAKPEPAPAAAPAPSPEPAPVAQAEGLSISLEARRLDASLMATTLSYQLRLTNHGTAPLSALAIEGDMVAAHSSLPVEQQIASPEQKLELRHALVELAPGASAEFKGEMRLPLTAITPIRAGNAAYFVPLARLRVAAAVTADESLILAQTFVIGELPDQPGGALRPLRLDLGPRTFGKLGQRAVG